LRLLKDANLIDNKLLKRSDVDLIFTAELSPGSKTIDYAQFLHALDVICATIFSDVKEYPGNLYSSFSFYNGLLFCLFLSMNIPVVNIIGCFPSFIDLFILFTLVPFSFLLFQWTVT